MKLLHILTKLKCITVEPVLFLYMMVIFLESSALQELIYVKSCLKLLNSTNISDCSVKNKTHISIIENETTYWSRYSQGFLFFFTFLSSFFVASWSDKFGRKFPMIIPPIGTIIAASINYILSVFMYTHVAYLFISSTISGLTFGTVGIVAATFGFVTDISDESSRTKRMMILEAMIFIGGTLGIFIAGKFLEHADYELKMNGFSELFIFEIFVSVVITLYIILRIPGQTDNTEFSEVSCKNLFKFDHIKNTLKTVLQPRINGRRKIILLLLLALFFIYFGLVVQLTLAYYFLKSAMKWEFSQYTIFNSIQFAVEGTVLLVGMPLFFHLLHIPDHLIAVLGVLSKMSGYILFGLSKNDVMVYSCIALYMFSEYPVPAIRSILSKIVNVDEKGRIFAFTTILQNFCFFLGSFTLTTIFRSTETFFPGLCFEIVASFQAVATCIILYLYFNQGERIINYDIMENEDGSIEETCSITRSNASIN